ncbi:MAG: S9 family peptidase, partial [Anaerolineales bacterium]
LSLLYGKPLDQRKKGEEVPLIAFGGGFFTRNNNLVFENAIFKDTYGLGLIDVDDPEEAIEVPISGLEHTGAGEFEGLRELDNGHTLLFFNIDGVSWAYEAEFDPEKKTMQVLHTLVGTGELAEGVLEAIAYDHDSDMFVTAFSTATSPTQIYMIEGKNRDQLIRQTNESILGIPEKLLSPGEDYAYTTFDGLRVSARLYMPSPSLGFKGKRPLIYYL